LTIEAAVKEAEEIRVTLASGMQVQAVLVGSDPISGIAVIRAEAENLPTVIMGDSEGVRIGHYAFLLGNDFGNLVPAFGSVHEIYKDRDLFQVSARVQSSYGGAPVFCSNGRVGGMVWRYQAPVRALSQDDGPLSQAFLGWNPMPSSVFVIPINRAMRVARSLVAHGQMAYGRLGVEVAQRGNEVVVVGIQPDSPAAQIGLQVGDVVLSFHDRSIAGPIHLQRMVMESVPGETTTLGIRRDGRIVAEQVTLSHMLRPTLAASTSASPVTPEDAVIYQQINHLQQEVVRLLQIMRR
ncbi:MAG: PDZ domain-containing protein, partial [Candidatus Latescibacteria bacterium]|nr:PDZ domain-containing protein [Candidatus Latescibacterota bacterium]